MRLEFRQRALQIVHKALAGHLKDASVEVVRHECQLGTVLAKLDVCDLADDDKVKKKHSTDHRTARAWSTCSEMRVRGTFIDRVS